MVGDGIISIPPLLLVTLLVAVPTVVVSLGGRSKDLTVLDFGGSSVEVGRLGFPGASSHKNGMVATVLGGGVGPSCSVVGLVGSEKRESLGGVETGSLNSGTGNIMCVFRCRLRW